MTESEAFRHYKEMKEIHDRNTTNMHQRLGPNYWYLTLRKNETPGQPIVCYEKLNKNSELQCIKIDKSPD